MKISKKELKKSLEKLEKGSIVTVTDYSEYKEGSSNTGGNYSYTERYKKLENDKWEVSYSTSSVFYYCPYCGYFASGECSCYEEYEEISSEELAGILKYAWEDPDFGVVIK